ncbi:uncharacterized protein RJT20DRAFT_127780 [Scheffersomyces xylosifermentans]|uniref:uncharacterized protein n=1 Tax=Scheffersomyces xylosifermentans TaxID=1304137 RepID=UPI00315C5213
MTAVDDRTNALLEWIKNTQDETLKPSTHSYISPKIEVREFPDSGRGIGAKESIKRSEELLRIPPSFLINFNTVVCHITKHNKNIKLKEPHYLNIYTPFNVQEDKFTKIYSKFSMNELLELTSFQLLSLYLTFENQRGKKSFWQPFINMLPDSSDFDLNPLIWKVLEVKHHDELLKMLPTTTQSHTDKVYKRFIGDYDLVKEVLSEKLEDGDSVHSFLPLELFLWAWMCINSRCLYMTIPQGKTNADNFTMAPYVDFLNHSCNDQCSIKIDVLGFHVQTTSSYTPGEQLFLSYGPHSNDFLLCEYGFIIPKDNKWNDLDISSFIIPLLRPRQEEFLKENDYYDNYTMTKDGLSFRTDVVLAVLQEDYPQTSRKLSALLNGVSDGSAYRSHSNALIKEILHKVLHESDKYKHLEFNDDNDELTRARKRTIGVLYKNRQEIALAVLEELD